jgi:hypothetical protein
MFIVPDTLAAPDPELTSSHADGLCKVLGFPLSPCGLNGPVVIGVDICPLVAEPTGNAFRPCWCSSPHSPLFGVCAGLSVVTPTNQLRYKVRTPSQPTSQRENQNHFHYDNKTQRSNTCSPMDFCTVPL